ncbi:histidine kinase [Marinifilum sp.]|uniref:sensor histidine kinase n=1 Tax=Marinifilum sp. TaxID=2033137 RepID=UPI003BABF02A
MRKSLAKKLLVNFVVLNLLSILIVGVFAYKQAKDALILRTYNQLTSVRIEKQKRVEHFFQQRINEVKALCNLDFQPSLQKITPELLHDKIEHSIINKAFSSLLSNNNTYHNIYIYLSELENTAFNIDGRAESISSASITAEYKQLFSSLLAGNGISIHELFVNTDKLHTEVLICQSIKIKQQSVVIAFSLNMDGINAIMLDRNPLNGLGESGEAYLVGEDHFLRSASRFKENAVFTLKSATKGVKLAYKDSIGSAIFQDYRGIKVLSSFSKMNLPDLNWAILAEMDHQEAMIPIRNYGNSMVYILIILSLLLLGVVSIIASNITAPIRKLQAETEKVSSGIYEPVSDIKAEGEIQELVTAFNQMTSKIKEQKENIQLAKDQSISSMIDGQETERNRLARELHDGLAQTVLAIKMHLENAATENSVEVLKKSREMLSDLLAEIRVMSNDLMPAVLREFGLKDALCSLLHQIEENTHLQTNLEVHEDLLPQIGKKSETYLYRIAQEALSNIIKHANAGKVSIFIYQKSDFLFFKIEDDGIGLNDNKKNGNGLSNIKERISILGGQAILKNIQPVGFRVMCKIPLSKLLV